jgi:hypothetical protein
MLPTAQRYLQKQREVSSSMPMFPASHQVPSKQNNSSTEIKLTLNHVLQASATHQCLSNVATTDLALNRVLQSSATQQCFINVCKNRSGPQSRPATNTPCFQRHQCLQQQQHKGSRIDPALSRRCFYCPAGTQHTIVPLCHKGAAAHSPL